MLYKTALKKIYEIYDIVYDDLSSMELLSPDDEEFLVSIEKGKEDLNNTQVSRLNRIYKQINIPNDKNIPIEEENENDEEEDFTPFNEEEDEG